MSDQENETDSGGDQQGGVHLGATQSLTHMSMAAMARAAYGAALFVVPGRVLAAAGAQDPGRRIATVARVLGARELVEAAVLQFRSSARLAARIIDLAHVATMVGVAAARPDLRRVALASAAVDAALAIGETT